MPDTSIVLLITFVVLYLAFLFWYGGRSKPLSQAEVENLLAEIKRRGGKQLQASEPPFSSNSVIWRKATMGVNSIWSTCSSSAKKRFIQKEARMAKIR